MAQGGLDNQLTRRGERARPLSLTRRGVVAGALGTAGASMLGAGLVRPGGGIAGLTGLAAQETVVELPEILELESEHGLRLVDLYVREGGRTRFGYALCDDPSLPECEPMSPGPTLRLYRGDRLRLRLHNRLPEGGTNLHVHGLHVTPRATSDNIFVHVHPGQDFPFEYQIPMHHRSGLFWYHPHNHGNSNPQVDGGLAGAIIIAERDDDPPEFRYEPDAVKGVPERLLIFQRLSALDNQVHVNGALAPEIQFRPGAWERWRILNASSRSFINLYLDGVPFYRVADDGNWLEEAVKAPVVPVGPAERAEVLVFLEDRPSYQLVALSAAADQGGLRVPVFRPAPGPIDVTLATLKPRPSPEAAAATPVPAEPPTVLLPLRDLRGVVDKPKRTFRLQTHDMSAPRFRIDNKGFHEGRVDQTVELNGVEEWTVESETDAFSGWHPLHIHVNDFQVDAIELAAPDPDLEKLLQELFDPVFFTDTVPVPIGGTVKIIAEFLDFTGKFVYHCHFLDHEDDSMMGVIDVAKSVKIVGSTFSEPLATVHAGPTVAPLVNSGTTVVWTNSEAIEATHAITADAVDLLSGQPLFDSGPLAKGRSFAHTFDAPGNFTYHCSCDAHSGVSGAVVVTAEQPIDLHHSGLIPAEVRIAVGTVVTWTNRDAAPRTVTIDAAGAAGTPIFISDELAQGESASHTFNESGNFVYDGETMPAIVVRPVTRQSVSVGIVDMALPLPKLQVFKDSTLTWTNRSGYPVSIAAPGAEPSGVLDPEATPPLAMALSPGQRFSHTFAVAGAMEYTVTRTDIETTPEIAPELPALTGTVEVIEPIELVDFGVFAIESPVATIPAGAAVGWINRDVVAHTITADALEFATAAPVFATGPIAPGAVHRQIFPTPGEFTYRCTAHPEHSSIAGKIVVMPTPELGGDEAFAMLGVLPAARAPEASEASAASAASGHTSGGGSS